MTIDFDPTVDHYKVLGVDQKASADEIKKIYRKLAKQYHPDTTGGDKKKEARFKEISAAYEILGDAAKRAKYDEVREQIRQGRVRPGGPMPGGPGGPQVWDLSDLFAQFFQGQGRPGGGAVHFEVEEDVPWPFGGAAPGPAARPGQGQRQRRREARRARAEPEPAPIFESRVRAPDGSWLTVKGADVYSDVRLPFQDAILGTVREVPTATGTAKVKIPPGTSSGVKLRLRGKGVVDSTGQAGDHYVTVQIDVPRDLDDEARRRLVDLTRYLDGLRRGR